GSVEKVVTSARHANAPIQAGLHGWEDGELGRATQSRRLPATIVLASAQSRLELSLPVLFTRTCLPLEWPSCTIA
ncbi:hypothetical protein M8C21_029658, partial [Ambrosia artemisiifolia]